MPNNGLLSTTPSGFALRALEPVPSEAVSVRWTAHREVDDRLLAGRYGWSEGDSVPSASGALLRVSLAVVPDPDGRARAVVVAAGEIDVATAWALQSATLAVATAAAAQPGHSPGAAPLLLDWSGVTFLDNSALYLLSDLYALGLERGWALRWIPPSAPGPVRLLRLGADRGWLPQAIADQVPVPATPVRSSRAAEMGG